MRIVFASCFAMLLLATAAAQEIQILSEEFDYTAREVFFRQPVTYLDVQKKPAQTRIALKVLIRGEGFSEGSLGPLFFLGEIPANSHYISPDGKQVAVYFYELKRLPERSWVVVQNKPGLRVRFKRPFELREVKRLSPEIRRRHNLPDFP